MDRLLGNWKLLLNENFSEFLKFTQVPWYQRKLAEYSGIDINISKNGEEYSLNNEGGYLFIWINWYLQSFDCGQ